MKLVTQRDQVAVWRARKEFRSKHGGLTASVDGREVCAPSYLTEYHHVRAFTPPVTPFSPTSVQAWERMIADIDARAVDKGGGADGPKK